MNRMKIGVVMFAVVIALGCGGAATEAPAPAEEVTVAPVEEDAVVEARHDLIYKCGCGPECDCGEVSTEAGTCGCGSEMVPAHVLMVTGNVATICACGEGCTCELNAEDPTTCTCGQPVAEMSFEGTGLYYCNCGGSCTCNFVASEPGTCACGMELVTS